MINKIVSFLNQYDLDVRKSHDARFIDQKCTPDVVCFIADCIMNVVGENQEFVVDTIWESGYFNHNIKAIYNKPAAHEKTAQHEYDKFIQQPLRMLATAHVLHIEKKGNRNHYRVNNSEILEYISIKERNAFHFIYLYLQKVLSDSGIWNRFLDYKDNCNETAYLELRNKFIQFIIGNTAINGAVEIRRIFPKIINIFAVYHHINGSVKGRMSKHAFSFSDLMYNRENWRDTNKAKSETRQQASDDSPDSQNAYLDYHIQKAKAQIKKIHKNKSEVNDQWATGDATQVHHIFPKHLFPSISYYLENLILLTATQHYTKAHPNNTTFDINKDYQLVCLIAKSNTIERSIAKYGETYYNKALFLHVLYVGLHLSIPQESSFSEIQNILIHIYNAA